MSQPTITINIAEAGAPLSNGTRSKPGHMWYEISDGNGHNYSFGFAPIESFHGLPIAPGKVYDNDSSSYLERDATRTLSITAEQFNALLSFGRQPDTAGYDFSTFYNGLTNSCVDFTWKALQVAGIIPFNSTDGDLFPSFNDVEIGILGNSFVFEASQLVQDNYSDALATQGLNDRIVNGGSYFLSVAEVKEERTGRILSPAVLFEVSVNSITGQKTYHPISYPTPSPEADNPTTYAKFDLTTGETKIYNVGTLTTLNSLATSHHLTLDQLINLKGNESLAGRTIMGEHGALLFLYQDTDHIRVTPQDNDFNYAVLTNGHLGYDPEADNPPITGPVDNSLLDFTVGDRLGDTSNAWQTGSALSGANSSANMPVSILNGDGLKNTAPSSTVSNDFRPGNEQNSNMAQILAQMERTAAAVQRSAEITLANMINNNVTPSSSSAINYFQLNSNSLSSNFLSSTTLTSYYTDSPRFLNTDPLILDLNGDGVHLTNFRTDPVLFNTDADSAKERTGWVSKDDGILVLDKNHDGVINDLTETFSEFFAANVKNGFEALKNFSAANDNSVFRYTSTTNG